jgi:hypothetical protein
VNGNTPQTKKFDKVCGMQRYNKKYTEHYARLALMSYYDPKYEALEVTESPDLQSEPLGVGIEVTQAISNMEGRCNHYDAKTTDR